ncbi:MAG: hypothetical protein JWM95_549 [Gemmatimonadetes bacterium]|nr:hypothetical protein [Gemmatimonadota bacterium]
MAVSIISQKLDFLPNATYSLSRTLTLTYPRTGDTAMATRSNRKQKQNTSPPNWAASNDSLLRLTAMSGRRYGA